MQYQNNWFGHTISHTPHPIPNCEVKADQAQKSIQVGDSWRTLSAERFNIFLNFQLRQNIKYRYNS